MIAASTALAAGQAKLAGETGRREKAVQEARSRLEADHAKRSALARAIMAEKDATVGSLQAKLNALEGLKRANGLALGAEPAPEAEAGARGAEAPARLGGLPRGRLGETISSAPPTISSAPHTISAGKRRGAGGDEARAREAARDVRNPLG